MKGARPVSLGIRAQLMLFLAFICLLLLGLYWFLSTQLLQPLYNQRIEAQLAGQADEIVSLMDQAVADGSKISSWNFGVLVVDSSFRTSLYESLSANTQLTNFCVDISDSTLRSSITIENLYPCLLHNSTLSPRSDDSNLTFSWDKSTAIEMRRACRAAGSWDQVLSTSGGSSQMVVGRMSSDGAYSVLVSTSLVHVAEAGQVLSDMLPLIALLVFAFALSAAWLFSQWFTRPLRQLSAAARQVARGDYSVHVESRRRDELGTLAEDFNQMAKDVQRSAQMQRDLLANVSHDLRTPLTLIKGYAETVRDITGDDKAHRDEQLNIIIDETDRLTALVSSVMELTKVTSGAEKCEPVRFDMGQLCDEVSERYDAVCAQNGWTLKLETPDQPLEVWADPAMIERALHNLLGNAMHHIGPDGVFILRLQPCGEGVQVEVEDHGPGISADDLPYIFERYYRSRSDAGKAGTGLGLSITRAIFQQHGFRFGVQSTVGQGTTFWFIMKPPPPAALPPHEHEPST